MSDDDPLCWLLVLDNTPSLYNARVVVSEVLHFNIVGNSKDNEVFAGTFPVNFGPVQDYTEGSLGGNQFKDLHSFAFYVNAVSANREFKGAVNVLVWGHTDYLGDPSIFVPMTTKSRV